ncbi:unnamed protein product [Musa acuminata subsp. malaccensis]|uniref:(wild Malaysian banana) hypothetical protein n=1 Tax=Musa acuminata subsp. malaccensis TaxID=214687 RepID=A0A804KQ78_MUSAM|nr:unnamed protein product [Musa acuminata subsp. malaccensis]
MKCGNSLIFFYIFILLHFELCYLQNYHILYKKKTRKHRPHCRVSLSPHIALAFDAALAPVSPIPLDFTCTGLSSMRIWWSPNRGSIRCWLSSTIATLEKRIVSEWPREKVDKLPKKTPYSCTIT